MRNSYKAIAAATLGAIMLATVDAAVSRSLRVKRAPWEAACWVQAPARSLAPPSAIPPRARRSAAESAFGRLRRGQFNAESTGPKSANPGPDLAAAAGNRGATPRNGADATAAADRVVPGMRCVRASHFSRSPGEVARSKADRPETAQLRDLNDRRYFSSAGRQDLRSGAGWHGPDTEVLTRHSRTRDSSPRQALSINS